MGSGMQSRTGQNNSRVAQRRRLDGGNTIQYMYLHFTLSFTVADLNTLQLMVPDRGRKKMVTFNTNYSVGWLNDKVHVRIELQLVVIARLVMLVNSELKNLQIAHIRCFEPQKQ